jgi:hypothetical protein
MTGMVWHSMDGRGLDGRDMAWHGHSGMECFSVAGAVGPSADGPGGAEWGLAKCGMAGVARRD